MSHETFSVIFKQRDTEAFIVYFEAVLNLFRPVCLHFHTVRNLHFLSKNSTLIYRENCRFFWVKNSWKCCGFGLFSCWQLWFHEKNCQKKNWVKNSWKCWGFVKIEFLDKNLTFRIVCCIIPKRTYGYHNECQCIFHVIIDLNLNHNHILRLFCSLHEDIRLIQCICHIDVLPCKRLQNLKINNYKMI